MLRALPAAGVLLPGFGMVQAWQATFLLAGLPGLPLMALMLLVREPVRRESIGRERADRRVPALCAKPSGCRVSNRHGHDADVHRRLRHLRMGAGTVRQKLSHRAGRFRPDTRLIFAATGIVAPLFGGWLSDRWVAQGRKAARFRMTMVAVTLLTPGAILWSMMPTAAQSFVMLALFLSGLSLAQSSIPAAIQDVVPNQMRGQMVALYMLFAGLFGIGLGPTLVALVTDRILQDEAALQWSIAVVALPSSLVALSVGWSGQRAYERMCRDRLAGDDGLEGSDRGGHDKPVRSHDSGEA